MNPYTKMESRRYPGVFLKVIPGHFVTPHSHINSYVDMTTMKSRQAEAHACAHALAQSYAKGMRVDTIVCMDNTEVIGAYLADELDAVGVQTENLHRTIYVTTPEYDAYGQMIFRDNARIMLQDKHVLLLLATTTTGKTLSRSLNTIAYHGGTVVAISAIFSMTKNVGDIAVHALFDEAELTGYETYSPESCKMCQDGMPIDALCNGFGYSEVNR